MRSATQVCKAGVVVIMVGLSACTSSRQAKAPDSWHTSLQAVSATASPSVVHAADQRLLASVNQRLFMETNVDLSNVRATATRGVVHLLGTADNHLAKERARLLAESVAGAKAVIDRVELRIPLRADASIERDVLEAFEREPITKGIEVSAFKQGVRLTGQVSSWYRKQLAETLARSVPGVFAIQNEVEILYAQSPSDGELEAEALAKLRWEPWLDASGIVVSASEGVVKLEGLVSTLFGRKRAESLARVEGAKRVDIERLWVSWPAQDPPTREGGRSEPDHEVRDTLLTALAQDPRLEGIQVDAEVEDGVVSLSGRVSTLSEKAWVENIAHSTSGVTQVKNRLRIEANGPTSDRALQRSIEQKLRLNRLTRDERISVSVVDREALLKGSVSTFRERKVAEDLVFELPGVSRVINRLEVGAELSLASRQADPTSPLATMQGATRAPLKSDPVLTRDIENRIAFDPLLDLSRIDVSVTDGVANLSGRVESQLELRAAIRNALEAGAISVDSSLEVRRTTQRTGDGGPSPE